jgi:hypothetical protein
MFIVSHGKTLRVIRRHDVGTTVPLLGNCETTTLRLDGAGSMPTGSRIDVTTCSSNPCGRTFVVSYGKTLRVISRHAVDATVPPLGNCETSTLDSRVAGSLSTDSRADVGKLAVGGGVSASVHEAVSMLRRAPSQGRGDLAT